MCHVFIQLYVDWVRVNSYPVHILLSLVFSVYVASPKREQERSSGPLNASMVDQVCLSQPAPSLFSSFPLNMSRCFIRSLFLELKIKRSMFIHTGEQIVKEPAGVNEDCWQDVELPAVRTSYFSICFCGMLLSVRCAVRLANTRLAAVPTIHKVLKMI